MPSKMYGQMLSRALNKEIDWLNDDVRVALLASAYVPDQDVHTNWADVSANEVTGTGYTAGGQGLTGKTKAYDAANNRITMDAADVTWSTSTITARYAVIYDNTPTTNKPLLAYVDFGADQSSTNGSFTIQWDAAGILEVTVA